MSNNKAETELIRSVKNYTFNLGYIERGFVKVQRGLLSLVPSKG